MPKKWVLNQLYFANFCSPDMNMVQQLETLIQYVKQWPAKEKTKSSS